MTFLDNHNLATFTDNIRYHRFFSGAKCFAIYQILAIQPRELELIISQVFEVPHFCRFVCYLKA
jgi:hypothetical protein